MMCCCHLRYWLVFAFVAFAMMFALLIKMDDFRRKINFSIHDIGISKKPKLEKEEETEGSSDEEESDFDCTVF